MLKYHLGHGDHLDRNDDDEYAEDSDYESESESSCGPVSQNIQVNSEQKQELKLFPIFDVGSSVA